MNQWYDMWEDWELIEASFAMQYPQEDLYGEDMDWKRFCTLLSGIMPETPLGQIVSLRSETRKDILESYTPEQKKIREDWIAKVHKEEQDSMSLEEKEEKLKELQEIFAKAFG